MVALSKDKDLCCIHIMLNRPGVCNLQVTGLFGFLNNLYFKLLSNFLYFT